MKNFNFKKKFGQNFLVDNNIVSKIVSDFDILPDSLVIEVGCGSGFLTKALCSKFDYVLGYEIDNDVKDDLMNNLSCFDNFKIIFDDFLNRDVLSDLESLSFENIYVIANLPYYITTPIIDKIINLNIGIEMMRFMVQKEVGERFTAKVGSKNYSSLSVYLNYHFDVKKNFIVSRNSFYPVPNVDSIIVSFYKKNNKYCLLDLNTFYSLIKDSFKFKRKTIKNNLRSYDLNIVLTVLKKHGFDLSVRAEQLDISIFCEISNELFLSKS